MSMAKIAKSLSMQVEMKAYDILYDTAQDMGVSVTGLIENLAYYIASKPKHDRVQMLQIVLNSKEPDK